MEQLRIAFIISFHIIHQNDDRYLHHPVIAELFIFYTTVFTHSEEYDTVHNLLYCIIQLFVIISISRQYFLVNKFRHSSISINASSTSVVPLFLVASANLSNDPENGSGRDVISHPTFPDSPGMLRTFILPVLALSFFCSVLDS